MVQLKLPSRKYLVILIISVAVLLQTAVIVVAESQRDREIEINKRVATQELSVLRARIEGRINANLIAVRGLQAEIIINPNIDQNRFTRLVSELLSDDLQIRHIALAPNLVVRNVYPYAGNEDAIGLDYRQLPEQYATVQRAIEARQMVLAGPVDLVQGGRALITRLPIFRSKAPDAELWGVIAQVLEIEALLDSAGFTNELNGFHIALRGANGEGLDGDIIAGQHNVWTQDYLSTPVSIPHGEWVLAAYPVAGKWHVDVSGFWVRLIFGTAIVLIITSILMLLLFTQLRLRGALTTISHQARFDPLTELPNRHYFLEQLDHLIQSALRKDSKFAVLFIDLDHFKEVNDSLGHDVGDILLQQIAERLKTCVRGEDLIARLGGDEFVVVLRDLDDNVQAEQHAQRIVEQVQPTLHLQQNEVSISASIGIAMFPIDGMRSSELLKHADLAMYAAKSAGRQTVYFFNSSLRFAAEQHINLHHDMLMGIERGEFEVHYQPVVDARTHDIYKCEALLRWNHPKHGMISPAEFIPVAEKTGAIRSLGKFVQAQVCADWLKLRAQGFNLSMSINRSPREFNRTNVAQEWLVALEQCGMPPDALIVEITESMLMRNQERQLYNLEQLRKAGVKVAIDDFGTGYSSLNYLRHYPVDFIKIDRCFLLGVPDNKQQNALLDALIRIAETLELEVIAEGVETQAQADLLKQQGCQYLQGFLFSRPIPFTALLERLQADAKRNG